MSSEESISTQFSTLSVKNGTAQNLKPHKSEQWEINLVGSFLLNLYNRLVITPQNNWIVKKTDLRKEFISFLTADLREKIKELNGTDNIGTILDRCGFICNTPRGSPFYQLNSLAFIGFRSKKLKEQDNQIVHTNINLEEGHFILQDKNAPKYGGASKYHYKKPSTYKNAENYSEVPSTSKAAVELNQCDALKEDNKTPQFNRGKRNPGNFRKQYNKGQQNSNVSSDDTKAQHKTNIDVIFDELPKVPKIYLARTKTPKIPMVRVRPIKQQHQQPLKTKQGDNFNMNSAAVPTPSSVTVSAQSSNEKNEETATGISPSSTPFPTVNHAQQQKHNEDEQYAKKLQQHFDEEKQEGNLYMNFAVVQQPSTATVSSQCSNEKIATGISPSPNSTSLPTVNHVQQQQQCEDEQYAKKLQQQFDDEKHCKQQTTTSSSQPTTPPPPPPAPELTADELFLSELQKRIDKINNDNQQYAKYMDEIRIKHYQEQSAYSKYKWDICIPHNREYERYWDKHLDQYEQEEDNYVAFARQQHLKYENELDQYDNYTGQKRNKNAENQCRIS